MCGGSDCKGGELTSCSCSCCCSLSLLGSAVCQQVQEQGSFQEEGVVYKASHIDAEALVPISSQAAQLCAGAGGWAPRLSSPVAAARLQRLSSGTHFLSNLAYSLLKPDTDLLQILFFPHHLFFLLFGWFTETLHSSSAATNQPPFQAPNRCVFCEGLLWQFWLWVKHRALADLPLSSNLLSKQLSLLSSIFPEQFLPLLWTRRGELSMVPVLRVMLWLEQGKRHNFTFWLPPSSKSPSQLLQECSQPIPVGLCWWGLKVLLSFSRASVQLKWVGVIVIHCVLHSLYKQGEFWELK